MVDEREPFQFSAWVRSDRTVESEAVLFRDGVEGSQLRTDLDVATAALLFLSAANWAYTWLRPGASIDELADRLYAALAVYYLIIISILSWGSEYVEKRLA